MTEPTEATISKRIPNVDSFLDVDTARREIEAELHRVYDAGADLWWKLKNPRLGNRTPDALWNENPTLYPDSRNRVIEVAFTTLTWKPEVKMESSGQEVNPNLVRRTGLALGAAVAELAVRLQQ